MKRIVKAMAGAASLLAVFASPALAGGSGAQKVSMLPDSVGDCSTGALQGGPPIGFAVLNEHHGTISAEVSLKGATPDHTYSLEIVQTPNGDGCFFPQATLTTNSQGNGNAHLDVPVAPGTTDAFVMIDPSDEYGFITSPDITFS